MLCWWPSGVPSCPSWTAIVFLPTSTASPSRRMPGRLARILALARRHGLSSYDATYLELAQRLGAALASFDRQLNQAARAIGVALYPETSP
jgi:PIN domain